MKIDPEDLKDGEQAAVEGQPAAAAALPAGRNRRSD